MGTAANVLVGAPGIAYFAPAGTALPTTPLATLNVAFTDLGLVSDDGLTEGHAQDLGEIVEWSGLTVRRDITKQTDTMKLTFLETNPDTLETYYGDQTDPSTVVEVKKQAGRRGRWVFDVLDGDNILRKVVPDGQVSEVDDISHKVGVAVAYGVTITCYPDGDGNTQLIYPLDASLS